jgi:hypothetical protein
MPAGRRGHEVVPCFWQQGGPLRLASDSPLVRARAPVRAVVTDATGGAHRDWYPAFAETAQRFYAVEEWPPGATVDAHPRTIRYDLRYPNLYPGEGQFREWKTRDPTALYRFLHLSPRTP